MSDADTYNAAQRERARAALAGRKYDPSSARTSPNTTTTWTSTTLTQTFKPNSPSLLQQRIGGERQSAKSKALDSAFFDTMASSKPTIVGRTGLPQAAIQGRIANDGSVIKKSANGQQGQAGSKKHNKANKRKKQRSGAGFD